MRKPTIAMIEKFHADLAKIPHNYAEIARRLGFKPNEVTKKLNNSEPITLAFLTRFYDRYGEFLKLLQFEQAQTVLQSMHEMVTSMRLETHYSLKLVRLNLIRKRRRKYARIAKRSRRDRCGN